MVLQPYTGVGGEWGSAGGGAGLELAVTLLPCLVLGRDD